MSTDLRDEIARLLADRGPHRWDWLNEEARERYRADADAVLAVVGKAAAPEPDRCPTCESDDRNVRGEEGFDVAEGTPYEGQGYIAFGTCSDRWHGAPGGES